VPLLPYHTPVPNEKGPEVNANRIWIALALAAPLLWAQGAEAPTQKTPEAEPEAEWRIEKPESNPTGDPVELKLALEPGMAHVMDVGMEMEMQNPQMPVQMETDVAARMEVKSRAEEGTYNVEMPFKITRMTMNGQDMTAMLGGMLNNPKISGKMTSKGRIVKGSIAAEGIQGPMKEQMGKQMEGMFTPLPDKPVRVGETWSQPTELFARRFATAGIEGAKIEGDVYQTLVAIEERDGVQCARIKGVFALRISGDNLKLQGGMVGQGEIVMKGEGYVLHGLDGYTRYGEEKVDMEMDVSIPAFGDQSTEMGIKMTITVRGKPEKLATITKGEDAKGDG
jgi:hypothetical protein